VVLAISGEETSTIQAFAEEHKFSFPFLLDSGQEKQFQQMLAQPGLR
jgi:peroxiredoxin